MGLPAKYDHLETIEEIHNFFLREAQLDAEAEREFFTDDYIHHTPSPYQASDFSGVAESDRRWAEAMSDTKLRVFSVVAQGDLVCAYKMITGRHTGDGSLIASVETPPPTGREVKIPIMDYSRYRDRQICEHWHVTDFRDLTSPTGYPVHVPAGFEANL